MSNVLVLGSNSFAASVLVDELLTKGHVVLGISRSLEPAKIFLPYKSNINLNSFRFLKIHIYEEYEKLTNAIDFFKPEYIFDFAGQGMVAESWANPSQWYLTNLIAKTKLYDYLRKTASLKKYIRVSTPEVYGSTEELVKENHPYLPSTPYAISHAAVDMTLKAYNINYNFPMVITRFANFYGAGQQLYRIIPKTVLEGITGGRLSLHGGGTSIRAFIHVRDVSTALIKVMDRGVAGNVYHFSPVEFLTIKNLVEMICDKMMIDFNSFVNVNYPERLGKDSAYLMDSSLARKELHWLPKYDLNEGLFQVINWIKPNIKQLSKMSWNYEHKA